MFKLDVIIIVDVVKSNYIESQVAKFLGKMKTNKTCSTCD
jgi:hypothetical protein